MNSIVSVIIPAKDRIERLRDTLDSVNRQSYSNFEVIVVENNSIDPLSIHALVKEYDERFVSYSMKRCVNANQARNYGSTLAKGSYLAFLDSDDLWDVDHLHHSIQTIQSHDVEFVYGGARIFDGKRYRIRGARDIGEGESPVDYLVGFNRSYAQTSSYVLSKKSLESVRWDESYFRCQDLDFFIRAVSLLTSKCSDKITTTIVWRNEDKRDYNVKSMIKFYSEHKVGMSFSSRFRYLALIAKTMTLTSS